MVDLSNILLNLSSSIEPVIELTKYLCFILGFFMFWMGLKKLSIIANHRARSSSGGHMYEPMAYFVGGAILFFLPTAVGVMSNSFFGTGSPIAYASMFNQYVAQYGEGAYVPVKIIQVAGLIWFVRGTVLMVQASKPGVQHGYKGLMYFVAGIFAINVKFTFEQLSTLTELIAKNTS